MLLRLTNGEKFKILQPVENRNGVMRGRQRATLEMTFDEDTEQFERIQQQCSAENLKKIVVYYSDNEDAQTPDQQLEDVAQKEFLGYQLVGEWKNLEVLKNEGNFESPPVYQRRLSVVLGQLQYGESL